MTLEQSAARMGDVETAESSLMRTVRDYVKLFDYECLRNDVKLWEKYWCVQNDDKLSEHYWCVRNDARL